MKALIVVAHPEPDSFTLALAAAGRLSLEQQGWEVAVSDLYRMQFKAVLDRDDFTTVSNPDRFNVSLEQRHAWTHQGLAPDVAAEVARLLATDLLILQFPLWWFAAPAILKGWIDRVFLSGVVYGRNAMFERGRLAGKRALICLTTGGPAEAFGPNGLYGEIDDLLRPLHRGVLGFTGMTVLPPFVCHDVPYAGDDARRDMLDRYRAHLNRLDTLEALAMPRLADHLDRLQPSLRRPAG